MKTHWIICYRQYGRWSATLPFESYHEAEKHCKMYLRRPEKDYIKDITFLEVELPR